MEVIKRDGSKVAFDGSKIENAILKAMRYGSGIVKPEIASKISHEIEDWHKSSGAASISIYRIEGQVFEKLIEKGEVLTAKAYEGYRKVREFQRETNTIDNAIYGIVNQTNKEAMDENSNKDATVLATQRDLIAGEFSRDYCRRLLLPPKIVQAHDDGIIHFHDMDYYIQKMHNCDLVNLKDMFANGTVINDKLIETPKSLQTACTVATQIVQQVANGQYGGQTISISHLAPYVRVSYKKHLKAVRKEGKEVGIDYTEEQIEKIAKSRLHEEIKAGVQTIQYQINTLMTTNGQSPFVTLFLNLDKDDPYIEENAMIIEEILRQRLEGIKNENGVYITPAFPKLIYVLDEHNCLNGGRYDYLTELAVRCSAKRMYPDYISAKKMRENYEGNVFSCMGCRSFLSPWKDENGNYKWEGRFNQGVVSINLPQMGLIARGDEEKFWELMEERLALCFEALMCRHRALEGTLSDVSPIHWQYGAIARLKKGEKIDKLLHNGYSTLSLGYIGLYELTKLMTGVSHTDPKGTEFALKVMNRMREATETWKKTTGLGFGLYGTPAESLCYRFAEIDRKRFGVIKDVTDKGYYTNSYHVDVREKIDAFEKFSFESQFQTISSGGAISYVEIPNMKNNIPALRELVKFIYDNIQYAEFNTKSDYCHVCGFDGEIIINEDLEWECPQCHNKDHSKMNVTRRTCGYLGENFWNVGKTKEINSRVLHL